MYLMWFDNDRRKQASRKIEEASQRFEQKFGRPPTVVLVNPGQSIDSASLPVVPKANVLPDFYWVGDENPDVKPPAVKASSSGAE